jgi:hypothetical protein
MLKNIYMSKDLRKVIRNKEILTKNDFYSFYYKNPLINKLPMWENYSALLKDNYRGKVGMRYSKGIGRKTRFNVSFYKIPKIIKKFEKEGFCGDDISFVMAQPDEKIILLGELKLTEKGIYLMYSQIKKPMKEALNEKTEHVFGLRAKFLLEKYLFPQSYSDIETLLELFPESIIEFTAYSIPFGILPNRNTIIWEIRNY